MSLSATSDTIRAKFTPRHAAADVLKFGNSSAYLIHCYQSANDYVAVYWSAASTLTLAFNDNGTGEATDSWAAATWAAGTSYDVEVEWDATSMRLVVDGTTRATIAGAVSFSTALTANVYFGSDKDGTNQWDGTVAAPDAAGPMPMAMHSYRQRRV